MVLPLKLNNDKFHTFCIIKKDENNNIHSFEKESIQYLKDYNIEFHPITNVRIPKEILDSVNIIIPKIKKTNDDLALDIIQILTHNSFFIDTKVLIELDNAKVDKLYYECYSFFTSNTLYVAEILLLSSSVTEPITIKSIPSTLKSL